MRGRALSVILGALLAVVPVRAETDPAGGASEAQSATPPEARGVDEAAVRYWHHDASGNLMAITDEAGAVIWRAAPRPFGQGAATPGSRPLRFAGQPREPELSGEGGLVHLGARTYDPLIGRFLSTDPLPLELIKRENPQLFNRYGYALNNPYRYHDATGLQPASQRETEARAALKNFIRFAEAKLGHKPSLRERIGAFSYGPATPPSEILATNNQAIRSVAGQEVDLDWGARLAGLAVLGALASLEQTLPALTLGLPAGYESIVARRAREEAVGIYLASKAAWNSIDTIGQQFGAERLTGPIRLDDPNFRGISLLIDYIVYGGDLRSYFDHAQAPPE